MNIPRIDLAGDKKQVALEIGAACEAMGFFCVANHGVDLHLATRLERLSREYFALDRAEKMKISMVHGGRAWRGFFPIGDELTSGRVGIKRISTTTMEPTVITFAVKSHRSFPNWLAPRDYSL